MVKHSFQDSGLFDYKQDTTRGDKECVAPVFPHALSPLVPPLDHGMTLFALNAANTQVLYAIQ